MGDATFNNISAILWQSVLMMEEETSVPKITLICQKSLANFTT